MSAILAPDRYAAVVRLHAAGMRNADIARELRIAPQHSHYFLKKLGLTKVGRVRA